MDILILLIPLTVCIGLIVLIFTAPRLIKWIPIMGGFLLIVTGSVCANGFPEGLLLGIIAGGLIALLGWVRLRTTIARSEEAGAWLAARSSTVCKRCGTTLVYHRWPIYFSQLLWGGWTCPNCGAESDVEMDVFNFSHSRRRTR